MKNLSKFDLGMIIAFVVVALLGGGAWWYLSGQLAAATADTAAAAQDFDQYSSKPPFLPTAANEKILQANIDLIKAQLDPLIHARLQSSSSRLSSLQKQDTVAWKHELDARVLELNDAAKTHGVAVPPNFYYGFSRYLNQNPGDEKTLVLSKQLLGIEQIATILINAPVKGIRTVRRTYEEDPPGSASGNMNDKESDVLHGNALVAPGGAYTAYPLEIAFDATTDSFRKVVDDLMQSPYVFVIRTLSVQNSRLDSPQIRDLDQMAGTPPPSVTQSAPGEVAATSYKIGPQFLFGSETLYVKARIDLIEWTGDISNTASPSANARPTRIPPSGGN